MRICVYGFFFSLGLQECARMTIPYDDIKIAHFSGALSLAQWVLDPVLHNTMSFDAFVQSRMLESFLAIVDKEKADEDAKGIVKLHLQHVTEVLRRPVLPVLRRPVPAVLRRPVRRRGIASCRCSTHGQAARTPATRSTIPTRWSSSWTARDGWGGPTIIKGF